MCRQGTIESDNCQQSTEVKTVTNSYRWLKQFAKGCGQIVEKGKSCGQLVE